jgi:hypothetical protein
MKPDFSGEWEADLSRSTVRGAAPQSMRVVIDHHEPVLREEVIVVKANGSEQQLGFECRTDRAENRMQGLPIGGSARWAGEELIIETVVSPERRFRDFWSLSSDGQILTMEHRDDLLAGQKMVWVKAPRQ